MDPENPSRRKKTDDTPVTIDLEAASTPAGDTGEAAVSGPTPETSATDAPEKPADASERPVHSRPDDPEPAVRSAEANEETPSQPPKGPAIPPRPGRSGALAAGIVGGLVALIGAGSLQYGGFLPAPGPQRGDDGALIALQNEIEAMKRQLSEAAGARIDLSPLETRLAALEQAGPETAGGAEAETVGRLESEIARLSGDLAAAREEIARTGAAVSTTEDQLTQRIAAAEQKLDEPRSDIEMARAVAASALKTAIDRGGPYLAELEAFASIAPEDPSVAGLREHAAAGVPSRSDLVRAFPETADAILDAVHQPQGDQGVFSRLLSSATSAIRVRPVGSIEGDTPEAVVARIENKLQNGDFAGARIEWQALPEAGQAAAAEFKRRLDARVTVEDLAGAAVAGAMAGGKQG